MTGGPVHDLRRGAGLSRAAAPVRLVHLGLGSFFRAHAAWYTDRSPDAPEWGIAAFGGRSGNLATTLAAQDHLYTLVTRGPAEDSFDVVASLSSTHDAADREAWLAHLASAAVGVVTITVTEAGYCRGPSGALDLDDPGVRSDVELLRRDPTAVVRTAPARLVAGLAARRRADAGPLALVSCDNLAANAVATRQVVRDLAAAVEPPLADWIDASVSFVSTMVDRITPATTTADVAEVARATGRCDAAPVVTEPFSEWVLSGAFPAGLPGWDVAGARLVDDVAPFEERKLRLLNGAHSLLAYLGSARGHDTVAEAIADESCLETVRRWWSDAEPHLGGPVAELVAYEDQLLARFANTRIEHRLAQIAVDGSQKLPVRVVPTISAERSAGRLPRGAVCTLAAWVCHLRGLGAPVVDVHAAELVPLAAGPLPRASRDVVRFVGGELADDAELVAAVASAAGEIERAAAR